MKLSKTIVPVAVAGLISLLLLRSDFVSFIIWWLALAVIGLVFMPLTSKLFSNFYDKGYLFSKAIGIAVPAYVLWLFSSLKLLPFDRVWIAAIYATALVVIFILFKGYRVLLEVFKDFKTLSFISYEEGIFILALGLWTFLRGGES